MFLKRKKPSGDTDSEDDISIYSEEVRESLLENDELTPTEEAFMSGYEDAA